MQAAGSRFGRSPPSSAAPRPVPQQARHTRNSSSLGDGPRPLPPPRRVPQDGDRSVLRLPRSPEGPFREAPSAKGPGEEPARGPKKLTYQPRPPAPTLQAASSSSAVEGSLASQRGSLPRPVILSSRVDGARLKEGGGRRFQDVNVGQARSCSFILPLR
ncbi:hypothetical protein NDU88_004225 [Pleurodeles waltl]|uniref:Uncharacterized protein n=1 Tax=Pleurodeles waltl TaxID=8319 RepID=A0AAV7QDW6_PLEWA|nr:hypothetical protein NDU88_004225 [Pleurodeles waltl]